MRRKVRGGLFLLFAVIEGYLVFTTEVFETYFAIMGIAFVYVVLDAFACHIRSDSKEPS